MLSGYGMVWLWYGKYGLNLDWVGPIIVVSSTRSEIKKGPSGVIQENLGGNMTVTERYCK